MAGDFAIAKVLASLPGTLEADTVYAVRVGTGYDLYITDSTGSIAYKQNAGSGGALPTTPQLTWGTSPQQPTLDASNLTAARTILLPDVAGTMALAGRLPQKSVTGNYTTVAGDAGSVLVWSGSMGEGITVDPTAMGDGTFLYIANGTAVPCALLAAASTSLFGKTTTTLSIPVRGCALVIASGVFARVFGDTEAPPEVLAAGRSAVFSDSYAGVRSTPTTDLTYTIVANAFPVGGAFPIFQGAAGKVSVVGGSGVTVRPTGGKTTTGVGDCIVAVQVDTNIWNLY